MRILLLLLISVTMSAQVSTITVGGVGYEIVGDSFSKYRTAGDYSTIDNADLNTYVDVFVRDAVVAGQDLALAVTDNTNVFNIFYRSALTLPINSLVFVGDDFYGTGRAPSGSSWGLNNPGFLVTINQTHWNRSTFTDADKFRLIYHELGHALLNYGHVCQYSVNIARNEYGILQHFSASGIMSTGDCSEYNTRIRGGVQVPDPGPGYTIVGTRCPAIPPAGIINWDCEDEGYDLRERSQLLSHFYETTVPVGSINNTNPTGKVGTISVVHD